MLRVYCTQSGIIVYVRRLEDTTFVSIASEFKGGGER